MVSNKDEVFLDDVNIPSMRLEGKHQSRVARRTMAPRMCLVFLTLCSAMLGRRADAANATGCGSKCHDLNDCLGQLICTDAKCTDDPNVGTHICSAATPSESAADDSRGCGLSCHDLNDCVGRLVCNRAKCTDDPAEGTHFCTQLSPAPSPGDGSESDASPWCGADCSGSDGYCKPNLLCINGICSDNPQYAKVCASGSSKKRAVVIGVTVSAAVVMLIVAAQFLVWRRHRREIGRKSFASRYGLAEVKRMTDNFSGDNLIGHGGFGDVYLGRLADGSRVAVKRQRNDKPLPLHIFKSEIQILSRVQHRFIVNFLGFCDQKEEHILLFEYMCNGNLRKQLHYQGSPMNWQVRMRIAFQIACGLEYLHNGANPPIVHMDLKPENVLLDANFGAKISDFGLSKMGEKDAMVFETTGAENMVGSKGYMDPQIRKTKTMSPKSDVYSFGVLLLELISGKRAMIEKNEMQESEFLASWAPRQSGNTRDLLDPCLRDSVKWEEFGEMWDLGLICVNDSREERPSMAEVKRKMQETLVMTKNLEEESVYLMTEFFSLP